MAESIRDLIPGRVGDWMVTRSGGQFWPCDPRPEEVLFEDVAHGLACENRFGGHLPEPYSVAQHSYYASIIVEKFLGGSIEDQLWALFHDASEAYLKDIPRPLKLALPEYRELEKRCMNAIIVKFGLAPIMPHCVRRADELCLAIERRDLLLANLPSAHDAHGRTWTLGGMELDLPPINFQFMPWKMAHTRFVGRYLQLTRGKDRRVYTPKKG